MFAGNDDQGRWTTLYETHGGGEGARAERDGAPVVRVHMSNVMNTPAEVIEAEYPIRVECQRLRRGSGGKGAHRGGEGLYREYRVLAEELSLTSMFERAVIPPYGLHGGEPGARFRVRVVPASGEAYGLPGKANVPLGRGDLVCAATRPPGAPATEWYPSAPDARWCWHSTCVPATSSARNAVHRTAPTATPRRYVVRAGSAVCRTGRPTSYATPG